MKQKENVMKLIHLYDMKSVGIRSVSTTTTMMFKRFQISELDGCSDQRQRDFPADRKASLLDD